MIKSNMLYFLLFNLLLCSCNKSDSQQVSNSPNFQAPDVRGEFDLDPKCSKLIFKFICPEYVKIKEGKITKHSIKDNLIPLDQISRNTVEFTRYLIQELFLTDPTKWGDRYWGINSHNFNDKIEAKLYFKPLKAHGKIINEIWGYNLIVGNHTIMSCLISKDGHIIYKTRDHNSSAWHVGYCKQKPDGIYIDIIDEITNEMEPTGIVTEYLFNNGSDKLDLIKRIDKRIDVLHYLNNYFDGKFWNGKK